MECEKCKMCGMVVKNLQIHVKLNHKRKYKGYQCQSKNTTNSLQPVQDQNILRGSKTPDKWDNIGREKSGIKRTTKGLIEVKKCPECKMQFTIVGDGKNNKKRGSVGNQSFRIYRDHVQACGLGGDYTPQTGIKEELNVPEEHFKVDKFLRHMMINEKDSRGRNGEGGCVSNDEYQSDLVDKVKKSPLEVLKEEVEELDRSGNCEIEDEAKMESSTDQTIASISSQQYTVSESVVRLHKNVAGKVTKSLNKYYPGTKEFSPHLHKIGSPEDQTRLAKEFSQQLSRKIKESYVAYHSTLKDIELTGDHEQFIRTEIDSYFEAIPRIR